VVLAAPAAWAWTNGITTAALIWTALIWTVVALVLAAWVAPEQPWIPRLPQPGPGATPPVVILSALAAWFAFDGQSLGRSALPFALAVAMPLLTRLGGGAVERAAAWFGRSVGNVISAVLFTLLGLLAVVVPWMVQRVLRIDPLHSTQGWNQRQRRDVQSAQPWAPSPTRVDISPAHRVRNVALGTVVVVGVVLATPGGRTLVATVANRVHATSDPFQLVAPKLNNGAGMEVRDAVPPGVTEFPSGPDGPQAAMETSASWMSTGLHQSAQSWALDPRNAWRPVNPHRLRDLSSKYLNIVNGERVTWSPPATGRPRLTVWLFGGSTAYGLNQRDDHTIASELARVAAEQGVELDVHNKGMNGQLHWMEAERFAWDLANEPAPDLAIFYDGVNESWEANLMNRFSTGDIPEMYDPTMVDAWERAWTDQNRTPPAAPPGAALIGRPTGATLELVDDARVTIERYDRARAISRATAEAHGIPVIYCWQPSRFSRPIVMAEPHSDTENENRSRLSEQLKASYLSDDVIDLTDSLRSNTEPLFTDDVHHNETGARLIAASLWAKTASQFEALAAAKGAPQ
jgi:lysophospholipase L1-like esterase